MLLDNQKIWSLSHGAIESEENEFGFSLLRFPRDYSERFSDFGNNAECGAGIKLCFETDASAINLNFKVCTPSLRTVILPSIDLYLDGALLKHEEYDLNEGEDGSFIVSFNNQEIHQIEMYLPLQVKIAFNSFELVDASYCKSIPYRKNKWLFLGDSITQGYFCKYPSLTYACLISKLCNVEVLNQGIGGYRFIPELIQPLSFKPNMIFVALGINDTISSDNVDETIPTFFDNLVALYPSLPIVAIMPIPDLQEHDKVRLAKVRSLICMQAKRYKNINIIDGAKLVPPLHEFYTDGLHPSVLGMQTYAINLSRELTKMWL